MPTVEAHAISGQKPPHQGRQTVGAAAQQKMGVDGYQGPDADSQKSGVESLFPLYINIFYLLPAPKGLVLFRSPK